MTGSDRPEPIDPADDSWPQEDPDLTRVVPMGTPTGAASASGDAGAQSAAAAESAADSAADSARDAAASAADSADAAGSGWSHTGSAASSWTAGQGAPSAGPGAESAGSAPAPAAPPSSYPHEPATTAVGPPSGPTPYPTGPAPTSSYGYASPAAAGAAAAGGDYQGGFASPPSYQQPYGTVPGPAAPGPITPPGAGPQVILPPATNVILPPTKIPQAESRVGINAIGTILGILLVFGGLILVLRFQDFHHQLTGGASEIDYLRFTWFVLGAVLVALPTFLVAWASWTALVPGVIVTGATIWAMITPATSGGAYYIDKGTGWAFGDITLGQFAAAGYGLLVGLPLLLTGLAAVFLRAGVRRTIVRQVESLQQ